MKPVTIPGVVIRLQDVTFATINAWAGWVCLHGVIRMSEITGATTVRQPL